LGAFDRALTLATALESKANELETAKEKLESLTTANQDLSIQCQGLRADVQQLCDEMPMHDEGPVTFKTGRP
jgi:hypothetical protein